MPASAQAAAEITFASSRRRCLSVRKEEDCASDDQVERTSSRYARARSTLPSICSICATWQVTAAARSCSPIERYRKRAFSACSRALRRSQHFVLVSDVVYFL